MSGVIKSVIEAKIGDTFNYAVIGFLDLLEYHRQSSTRWELKGAGITNGWLIECFWIDKKSMDDHFQLIQLQGL